MDAPHGVVGTACRTLRAWRSLHSAGPCRVLHIVWVQGVFIVLAYAVMAYIVMAYIVMAYVIMAYVVMAHVVMAVCSGIECWELLHIKL